jgi:hypothetical protein
MSNIMIYDDKEYTLYQSPKYKENKPLAPFHNDKKMMKVILKILEESDVFIETGSFMGKTIYFVGKNFAQLKCYSCEVNTDYYNIAHEQVKDLNNVKLDLMPSPYAVYNIHENYDDDIYDKKTCFWLDAHWNTDPLYDELKYITTNFKNFCIFVDDFTIPWDKGFWTDGYDIEKIKPYIINKDKLKFYMPNYPSNHECCKDSNVSGYIVITNMDINTFDNLKEIDINDY